MDGVKDSNPEKTGFLKNDFSLSPQWKSGKARQPIVINRQSAARKGAPIPIKATHNLKTKDAGAQLRKRPESVQITTKKIGESLSPGVRIFLFNFKDLPPVLLEPGWQAINRF